MVETIIAISLIIFATLGTSEWLKVLTTKGMLDALTFECADQLSTQILLLQSRGLLKINPGIKSDFNRLFINKIEKKMSQLFFLYQQSDRTGLPGDVRWYFNFMTVDGQEGFLVRANFCLPIVFESRATRNWQDRDCLGRIWNADGIALAIRAESFVPANGNRNIYTVGHAAPGVPSGLDRSEVLPLPQSTNLALLKFVTPYHAR